MTTAWEQVTAATELVSLPDIYLQLKTVLDNPDFILPDIVAVIEKDPAITARLLRMVNSAYFGLAVEIDSVSRAINLLGSQQIHDLVLATSVAQTFDHLSEDVMDMRLYWRQSVYCASASRLLAATCNVLDSERLFVAGLLRDIGHLVMYQTIPDLCNQILVAAKDRETPVYEMERNFVGFDYAMVGAELMKQWNLPASLLEPTKYHLEPAKSTDFALETAIIHIASKLTDAYSTVEESDAYLDAVDDAAWQVTGLNREQCLLADHQAREQVDDVTQLIFSDKFMRASA